MELTTYSKYKNSNNERLGEIPKHWEVIRLKYTLKELITGKREKAAEITKNKVLSIGGEHFDWFNNFVFENPKYISLEFYKKLNKGKVRENDILLVKDGATIGKLAYVNQVPDSKAAVNSHIYILRSNEEFYQKYIYHALWGKIGQDQINKLVRGSAQAGLNSQFLSQVFLPSPPLQEQKSIAHYLDDKTEKIDRLIEKKQQLIELLKEKRQAIINQAVTKGLNPDASMKESGIDWLGEVPEHWEVKKLKYVAFLKSGNNITSKEINPDDKYPVFGGNGIRGYTSDYTHDGDFVLIGRQGALCGCINYANGKFWASEHAVVSTILGENNFIWLGELLKTMNLNRYSQSAAQAGLAVNRISNLYIPVPPTDEQNEIADYLHTKTAKLNNLVKKISKEINLLKEYRTTLISEVVTGKVDVGEIKREKAVT